MAKRSITKAVTKNILGKVSEPKPQQVLPPPKIEPPAPGPPSKTDIIKGNVLQLIETSNKKDVAVRAEIGNMCLEARGALPHGAFGPWCADMPWEERVVQLAIKLYKFSEAHPTLFDKLKPLGIAKANALVPRPIAIIASIVDNLHTLPDGTVKAPAQLTYPQLLAILRKSKPSTKWQKLMNKLLRQMQALNNTIQEILDEIPEVAPDRTDDVYRELLTHLAHLAHHLDIHDDD